MTNCAVVFLLHFFICLNPSKDLVTWFQFETADFIVDFFRDCLALHKMFFVFICFVFDPSFPDLILIDPADVFQCIVG